MFLKFWCEDFLFLKYSMKSIDSAALNLYNTTWHELNIRFLLLKNNVKIFTLLIQIFINI